MKSIKDLFFNKEMSWKKVIIFAIITGVYTALINLIPFLRNTSLQDIAINLECWILFALIIILNCDNYKEASIKCFVFFLISQPLIFLIEAPFDPLGFGIFIHYRYWFILTILTIPGAIIAYQLKRKNWLSVVVLSIANIFLAILAIDYLKSCINNFPNHLLSLLFCIFLAVILTLVVFDDRKHQLVCLVVIILTLFIYSFIGGVSFKMAPTELYLDDGDWTYLVDNNDIVDVDLIDGNHLVITPKNSGNVFITLENELGEKIEYLATVNGKQIYLSEISE